MAGAGLARDTKGTRPPINHLTKGEDYGETMNNRDQETQTAAQLDFFTSCGVTTFNLAVRIAGQMLAGSTRPRSRAEVDRSVPWLRHENAHGGDAYIRPDRATPCALVFLYDVETATARQIAAEHRALAIETSPGRCHVWLATDRALTTAERGQVQRRLARQYGADPGSTSGEHFGRLAGFTNRKPDRASDGAAPWVTVIAEGHGARYGTAAVLGRSSPRELGEGKGGARAFQGPRMPAPAQPRPARARDDSGAEYGFALHALARARDAGRDPVAERERITVNITQHAMARGKRGTEAACRAYAERTVAAAMTQLDTVPPQPAQPAREHRARDGFGL